MDANRRERSRLSDDATWAVRDPRQREVYEGFLAEGDGQWTRLYVSTGNIAEHSVGQYSACLTQDWAKEAIDDPSWDLSLGSGGPGFSQAYSSGAPVTTYHRFSDHDVEPLVYYRNFHGVRPEELELSEEFRLLFNLWEDRKTRTYFYFDEAGNLVKAAAINENSVTALTSLVRRYQAVRQMHLALYIDSTLWSENLPHEHERWERKTDQENLSYYRDAVAGDRLFSRLFGKKLVPPPAIEESGIWPYEKSRSFESFIIAVDELGKEITHTSDPEQLANYFGKNPDRPHYLTPVFFRRDVLNKYYANPDLYSVDDGYIRCAGLWGLRLDNDLQEHVMVFLGDLGRDISLSEAQYWRSFNIAPQERVSETLIKRAFRGQFADPQSVDLRFARAYAGTNEAWEARCGWPLFKPLHKADEHVLARLHIPLLDTQAEFDEQVGYLAKLLVDSLNVEAITNAMRNGPKSDGGLARLQRLLAEQGVADPATTLRPFASIQGLRSRGAAHRKGSDYDLTVAIGELDRREGFAKLLSEAVQTLEFLRNHADGQGADSGDKADE